MPDKYNKNLEWLGLTKESLNHTCLTESVINALIEDHLDSEARALIMSHLNQCETCYFSWKQLCIIATQNNQQFVRQHAIDSVGTHQNTINYFKAGFCWQTVIPIAILTVSLIALVINISITSYKNSDTNLSAVATTLDADTLANSINQLPAAWDNQTFELAKAADTLAAKAVGVGIWSARNTLMNLDDALPLQLRSEPIINWKESEWQYYYALGQWILHAWVLANADHVKSAQWAVLRQSLQSLETSLKHRQHSEPQAIIALQIMGNMKTSLNHLSRIADHSTQNDLMTEIKSGLHQLFVTTTTQRNQ
jgi:hypothetical protein